MIELGAVAGFASVVQNLSIVGFLVLFILYLIYDKKKHTGSCDKMVEFLERLEAINLELKTQIQISNQIFAEAQKSNEKFREYIIAELRDIKPKVDFMHSKTRQRSTKSDRCEL